MSSPPLQAVRGTQDLTSQEARKRQWILKRARDSATAYGFQEIETPILEYSETFKRTLGQNSDIVYKEMYSFMDKGGKEVTLRPEGTAGVARAYLSSAFDHKSSPKFFYSGPMFRYERPQKGRRRQFHQFGVEWIGAKNPFSDVEVLCLAYDFIKGLGFQDEITLELNSIGDLSSRKSYRKALVSFLSKKKHQLSPESLIRLDTNPLRILDSKSSTDQDILSSAPIILDYLNDASSLFFNKICESLQALNIPYKKNPFLVRGLDYYSHFVFEFKTKELGERQDTILAGGRYDGLIEAMGGPLTPGTGWAAGLDRFSLLLNKNTEGPRPFVLIPLNSSFDIHILQLSRLLRANGFFIECLFETKKGLSWKMEKANRLKAKAVLILGEREKKSREIRLKNMDLGEEKLIKESDIIKELKSLHIS